MCVGVYMCRGGGAFMSEEERLCEVFENEAIARTTLTFTRKKVTPYVRRERQSWM